MDTGWPLSNFHFQEVDSVTYGLSCDLLLHVFSMHWEGSTIIPGKGYD